MTNAPYMPAGAQTYNLGTSIGSTDATILLSSFLEPVTNIPYTMALMNTQIVFGTIAPKTTSSEFISFTGITQNAGGTATLTGVVRGLAKKYPFTTDAAYKLPHSGQTQFILSDAPQVFQEYVSLNNDQTIGGTNIFTVSPTIPTVLSSAIHQAASIEYVNNIALSGAPNASTTVKGIVQEATQAQVLAKTAAGSTGAELYVNPATLPSTLLSDYKVDTGSANAYAIAPSPAITAYTVGQMFSFKAVNANTTASTLNVNALGVKTIKNSLGGDLVANDILAGQIVVVEYDGTNFQMTSPLGNQTATALKSATTIVSVSAATAPTSGQVLTATAGTTATWQTLPTTYAAGVIADLVTTATGNNDVTVTIGFQPRIIKLYYFVQGHDASSATNTYFGVKGLGIFTGATLTANIPTWGSSVSAGGVALTGDNGNLSTYISNFTSEVNVATPITAGTNSNQNEDILITLTINAVSATGFTVRRATDIGTGTNSSNARCKLSYEAFA